MKTETFVPERKYHAARAIAIFSTFGCAILMVVVLTMANEVNRLYTILDNL